MTPVHRHRWETVTVRGVTYARCAICGRRHRR